MEVTIRKLDDESTWRSGGRGFIVESNGHRHVGGGEGRFVLYPSRSLCPSL